MSSWPTHFPFTPPRLVDSPDYNLIVDNLTGSQVKTGSFTISGNTILSGSTYITGNLIFSGSSSGSNLLARPGSGNLTTIYDINGNILAEYVVGRELVATDTGANYLFTDLIGNVLFKFQSGSFSANHNIATTKLLYGSISPNQVGISGSFVSTGLGVVYVPQVSSIAKVICTFTGTNLSGGTALITGLIVRAGGSSIPALNSSSSSYPGFVVEPRVITTSIPTGLYGSGNYSSSFSLQIAAIDDGVFRSGNSPLIAGQTYNYTFLLSGSNIPIQLDSISIIVEEI